MASVSPILGPKQRASLPDFDTSLAAFFTGTCGCLANPSLAVGPQRTTKEDHYANTRYSMEQHGAAPVRGYAPATCRARRLRDNHAATGTSTRHAGTVTIGVSLPLTGTFSDDGKATRQGYALWQE